MSSIHTLFSTRYGLPILCLITTALLMIVSSSAEARNRRGHSPKLSVENQVAIDAFFDQESLTITLSPQQYIPDLNEVIVPIKLSNGATLRIEIPWDEPDLLEELPWVTLYPLEMREFAGRISTRKEVSVIERPIGKHIAKRSTATLCGNRSVSTLGLIETPHGSEETEIGFIFQPEASDFVTRSVAEGTGCPLLASSRACRKHKYCEVRVGIPPFTLIISGKCYPGPWPLGKLCRCWLLAPDDKAVTTVFQN